MYNSAWMRKNVIALTWSSVRTSDALLETLAMPLGSRACESHACVCHLCRVVVCRSLTTSIAPMKYPCRLDNQSAASSGTHQSAINPLHPQNAHSKLRSLLRAPQYPHAGIASDSSRVPSPKGTETLDIIMTE